MTDPLTTTLRDIAATRVPDEDPWHGSGHAAATGDSGHAAVEGQHAIAASLGYRSTAKAEAGGAIVLAAYNNNYELVAVRASLVGENGVEPGKTYRLSEAGEFEVVK